jgi:hypothetical protein
MQLEIASVIALGRLGPNVLCGKYASNIGFSSVGAVVPTTGNFLLYVICRIGRISEAWYLRLILSPWYPKMLSSSPNIEYVHVGWKVCNVLFGMT